MRGAGLRSRLPRWPVTLAVVGVIIAGGAVAVAIWPHAWWWLVVVTVVAAVVIPPALATVPQASQRHLENDAPRAAVRLGWRLEGQGDVAGAKATYQRAIDSSDTDAAQVAAFFLGRLLEKQGDVAGAKAAYQQATHSRDADAASWAAFLLGRLLEGQGDMAGAKAVYQQAIDSAQADISERTIEGIAIRVEWTTDDLKPTRRADIIKLAILLRQLGHSVTMEEREPVIHRLGGGQIETVAIYIGTVAGAGLIGVIVTDVYNTVKEWTREQWKKKKKKVKETMSGPGRVLSSQSFTLYGPDGKPILYWKISYEGEREEIHREIGPQSGDKSS